MSTQKSASICQAADKPIRRFAISVSVALALFVAFLIFLPNLKTDRVGLTQSDTFVNFSNYADSNTGMAELNDYAPMFIPTKWNYLAKMSPPPTPDGWEIVAPSQSIRAEGLERIDFIKPYKSDIELGKSGLFRSIMRSVFSGLRKEESDIKKQNVNALVEIINKSTGQTEKSLKMISPESATILSSAELSITIYHDGWIGRPLLNRSTGDESLDVQIIKLLSQRGIYKNLSSGEYKVVYTP